MPSAPPRRWLLPIAAVALFGGFAGYQFAPWRESPRDAWAEISAAAAAGDYGAVWDRFDPASQARYAVTVKKFVEEHAPDRAAGLTDRERFVLLLELREDVRAQFLPAEVISSSWAGDTGGVELARPDPLSRSPMPPPTSRVYMTRHAGRRCLSYGSRPPE